MKNPTRQVVDKAGFGEGLMTAFMGEHPNPRTKQALDDSITGPQESSQGFARHGFRGDIVMENIECKANQQEIPRDV